MKTVHAVAAMFLTTATLMSGCANTNSRPVTSQSYSSTSGVINSIDVVKTGGDGIAGSGIGLGTVIGGVVGGVVGHQVGAGRGNTAATVAGAVGGAVVGHEIEKRNNTQDAYRVGVRLDNGSYQTVTQDSISDLRVGNRVRIENDRVYRY